MKKLTRFSVNFPITVLMIVLAIVLFGIISFEKLGVDLFPDLNNPRVFVELDAGESPPEEMERQFVEDIEALAMQQRDVIEVSSVCKVGSALITVEYSWDKDMDEAYLDLQKALTFNSQDDDLDEFNITRYDPNASPVLIVSMSHNTITDMDDLRKVGESYIRNELIRLEGVADVELSGDEEKEIVINTNNYLLEAHDLTTDDIVTQISNFNSNVSGGSIVELGTQYTIKGVSLLDNITDIENIIVGYTDEDDDSDNDDETSSIDRTPVFLKNVAKISYQNADPVNIVRINGKSCIGLSVYKETKFNTVKAVEDILERFEDIKKALPGYEFTIIQNQGNYITESINEVEDTALYGIILAVIVLYVFLRRINTTIIVSIAIPVSIIATFSLMYFNGLTLNIMTLGGLALGAGMLVDNAIVVLENIFRNMEAGMSVKEAAINGTAQVGGAITASTITTIVVFVPIVYLHGASGELFKDQAWTVVFALVSSLFVAILFIPMLVDKLIKNKPTEKVSSKSLQFNGYTKLLNRILDRKGIVILAAVILMAGTVLLFPFIGSEFMPKSETNEFSIELQLPEGTELNKTSATTVNIENIITQFLGDNLQTIFSRIGPSPDANDDEQTIFEGENTATIKVILAEDSKLSSETIISSLGKILNDIPDIEAEFVRDETALISILGTDEAPVVVEVKGEDLDVIEEITAKVKERMVNMNILFNVNTSIEGGTPAIDVVIDRYRAGLNDITVDEISSQLNDQLSGQDAGEMEYEGEMKNIVIKVPEVSLSEFNDIIIEGSDADFSIEELADIEIVSSPKEIYRRDQNRIAKITSQIKGDEALDKVVKQIENQISDINIPSNYQVLITGEEEMRKESMENLTFALLLSIVLVYMVLASQFESLIHPFTILLTIPLAGVGAILFLLVFGQTLNMMAYIGIIMLIGIAVNDSIILVDAINQYKRQGLPRRDAILQAGKHRIRPILMTTLTTILALLPLTLGFGQSASLRSSMALAVIGGLITSTILTLVVIPCVFDIFDHFKELVTRKGNQ